MKKQLLGFICFLLVLTSFGQINIEKYQEIINKADSLHDANNYQQALAFYTSAFKSMGDKSNVYDRMRAANAWLQTGNPDSAFSQLKSAGNSESLNFGAAYEIIYKKYLVPLHSDARWEDTKKYLFLQAYKNLLSDQWRKPRSSISLSKTDTTIAFALGEESINAFMHLNDPAYDFLKKKMFDKAYSFFKATVEHFDPSYIFYKNMMDYYKAIGDKGRAYIYFSKAEVIRYKQQSLISNSLFKPDSAIKAEYTAFSKMIGENFQPPEYLVSMVANSVLKDSLNENAYSLFKMNLANYPNSYRVHRDLELYYNNAGDKQKADEHKRKTLLLQYSLPENFFDPSFNIEQYVLERQRTLTKQKTTLPPYPEQFIEDIAFYFLFNKMFSKSEQLFKINARNYPTSFYAQKNMSFFYKTIKDTIKQKEYDLKAQEVAKKYGTRRLRVFSGGPVIDSTFDVTVSAPACQANCPVILIDDLHDKFTVTKGWDYITLLKLFSNDGFKVIRGRTYFTKQSLSKINVVVMGGGLLDREEMKVLNEWIRNGGSLLAFTHHNLSPIYQEYLKSLGIRTMEIEHTEDSLHGLIRDGFTISPSYIYFDAEDKLLGSHSIINGRNSSEKIKRVQTLASSTIIGPFGSVNLLPLAESAIDLISIDNPLDANTPVKTKGQRSHGIAFNFGKGKVVITDAWALKTLLYEPSERGHMGMNTPGNDNKQYALNIMRWLTGYLK